jgi:hypothetical protein
MQSDTTDLPCWDLEAADPRLDSEEFEQRWLAVVHTIDEIERRFEQYAINQEGARTVNAATIVVFEDLIERLNTTTRLHGGSDRPSWRKRRLRCEEYAAALHCCWYRTCSSVAAMSRRGSGSTACNSKRTCATLSTTAAGSKA